MTVAAAARHDVRAASIRVALMAVAVVAAAYIVVAAAVTVIVASNLTAQIDARLRDSLRQIASGPPNQQPGNGYEPPRGGRPMDRGGPQLFVWTVFPDGSIASPGTDTPDLPSEYRRITEPHDAVIDGTPMRLQGTAKGNETVVIGQSVATIENTTQTIVLAELLIAPLLLGTVFLGAVAIGRRVAAPIELARQRQMEFTADASHELRTPLSVIEAHTSLALQQDRSVEWYRRAFSRVDTEAKRIRRLLEDLLWLARFDATRGRPNAEPVDVAVMAAQTADRFSIVAESRHLALSVATGSESQVIVAPPEWLDRLLGVLLDNACKYSPDGGSVRVLVAPETDRVRLTVEDSGPGIPPEERERIFDRFHRATDTAGGAGLGLAIADAVVKATGGRWRIDRSPTGGASMSVSWPRALLGGREVAPRGTPAGSTAPSTPRAQVASDRASLVDR